MAPPADAPFVPPLLPATSQLGVPIYFTGEDFLKLTVKNAAAGVTVTLTGRTLAVGDLRPAPFTQTLVPATDRSDSTVTIPMPAGWLVNAQVIVSAGSPLTGQTWARLSVVHGNLSSAAELFTLASCYLTAKQPLSYPGTGVLNSLDGGGALRGREHFRNRADRRALGIAVVLFHPHHVGRRGESVLGAEHRRRRQYLFHRFGVAHADGEPGQHLLLRGRRQQSARAVRGLCGR